MIDIEELERLAKVAPSGSWKEIRNFGSNAIFAIQESLDNDEVVIYPTKNQSEFVEIGFGSGAKEWIEAATPDAISELIAEVRTLREDLQAAKLLAHANAEMFKAEREDMESLKRQCQTLSFELLGVIIDTEQGHGFDPVCLDTIKRVRDQLHGIAGTKPCA